jgi:hypothetical protein
VIVNDVPGHIAGQGTKTLTITNIGTGDHGDYTCDVTSPTAGITTTTANLKVHVITNKPVLVDPITFSPVRVAESFSFSIADHINTADHLTPTSYSASPLPDGLKLNATTGVISGKPSIALTPGTSKNYAVVLKATNAQGSDSRTVNLVVNSLPIGSVGSFAGFVPRNPGLNENLGGRVTLTPASNGSYSATIVNGATSHSYKGVVNATSGSTDVTGSFQIVRPGKDTLTITFVIDSPNDVLKATTLTDGTNTETVNGWRNVTPTLAYQGTHNFGLALAAPNPALPQGTGYGSFKVASNGTLTVSGRLPDGVSYTTATFVGPHGEVLVHQVSSTVDTVLGALDVNPGVAADFSDYLLNGTLSWSRKDQSAKTRLYRDAFGPVNLTATGGRYVVPVGTNVFKDLTYTVGVTLSNAALVFTDADFGDATPPVTPGVTVLVKTAGAVSVLAPNPRVTSLKATSSSGAFSGLFSLVDPNPLAPSTNIPRSKVAYQGLVYRDGANLVARGYFLLNNLPRVALETSSNTATVSGKVQLNKVP